MELPKSFLLILGFRTSFTSRDFPLTAYRSWVLRAPGVMVSLNTIRLSNEEASGLLVETRGSKNPIPESTSDSSIRSKSGMIDLRKLKSRFESVPEDINEEGLDTYVKAYILYLLGYILLPDTSQSISHVYLPLIELDVIDNYAWGAAVHAKIKHSLKDKRKLKLDCFAYALLIFSYERFGCLRDGFDKPETFPLFLGWNTVLEKRSRNSQKPKTRAYAKLLGQMKEDDVDWQPYGRIDLPDQESKQKWMMYACVYTICFHAIGIVHPDVCYKQLGLEKKNMKNNVKKLFSFRQLRSQRVSKHKGKDWRTTTNFYTHCNDRWAVRKEYIVKKDFQFESDLEMIDSNIGDGVDAEDVVDAEDGVEDVDAEDVVDAEDGVDAEDVVDAGGEDEWDGDDVGGEDEGHKEHAYNLRTFTKQPQRLSLSGRRFRGRKLKGGVDARGRRLKGGVDARGKELVTETTEEVVRTQRLSVRARSKDKQVLDTTEPTEKVVGVPRGRKEHGYNLRTFTKQPQRLSLSGKKWIGENKLSDTDAGDGEEFEREKRTPRGPAKKKAA